MQPICADTLEAIAAIFRGSVLLIASFGACMCIYLGWRLYKDGVVSAVNGDFKKGDWAFTLSAAGPGVFFALFGMGLLAFLTYTRATFTNEHPVSTSASNNKPNAVFEEVPAVGSAGVLLYQISDSSQTRQGAPKNPNPHSCIVEYNTFSFLQGYSPTFQQFASDLTFVQTNLQSQLTSEANIETRLKLTTAAQTISIIQRGLLH